MKTLPKVLILLFLAGAIASTLALKAKQAKPGSQTKEAATRANAEALTPSEADVATAPAEAAAPGFVTQSHQSAKSVPKLVDVGADKCIPCKMMAPILEELKKEYAGRMEVQFVDVWKNPDAAQTYGVEMIPTQIFYDASGNELLRHTGFFSKKDILAAWKDLGVNLSAPAIAAAPTPAPTFSRLEPAAPDQRPKETICYMCDGDINPKTRTVLGTDKGEVAFCSPHCYFITYSSMDENKPSPERVSVTDWSSGAMLPARSAKYVYGVDAANRLTIKAFADPAQAIAEQRTVGGTVVEWATLQNKELATRCGFCDRAVYPEDACAVRVDGLSTWGCCTMCALGVAARMQKDIEVLAKDALTQEPITVMTVAGHVGLLVPKTAIAWAGTRKDAEGKLVSTGCFKQAFFANEANLKKWVEGHPTATGRMIPIEQALAEKMKMTPQQISKACKIGECAPK